MKRTVSRGAAVHAAASGKGKTPEGSSTALLAPVDSANANHSARRAAAITAKRDEGTELLHSGGFTGGAVRDSTSPSPSPVPPEKQKSGTAADAEDRHTPERLCAPGYHPHGHAKLRHNTAHPEVPPSAPTESRPTAASATLPSTLIPCGSDSLHETDSAYFVRYKRPILAPLDANTIAAVGPVSSASSFTTKLHPVGRASDGYYGGGQAPSTDRLFSVDPSSQSRRTFGEGPARADSRGALSATDRREPPRVAPASGQQQQQQQPHVRRPRSTKGGDRMAFLQSRRSCSTLCPTTITSTEGNNTHQRGLSSGSCGDSRRTAAVEERGDNGGEATRRASPIPVMLCVKVFLSVAHAPLQPLDEGPFFVLQLPGRVDLRTATGGDVLARLQGCLRRLHPASARLGGGGGGGGLQLTAEDNAYPSSSSSPAMAAFLTPPYRTSSVVLLPEASLGDCFDLCELSRALGLDVSHRPSSPPPASAGNVTAATLVFRWLSPHLSLPAAAASVARQLPLTLEDSPEASAAAGGVTRGGRGSAWHADPEALEGSRSRVVRPAWPTSSASPSQSASSGRGHLRESRPWQEDSDGVHRSYNGHHQDRRTSSDAFDTSKERRPRQRSQGEERRSEEDGEGCEDDTGSVRVIPVSPTDPPLPSQPASAPSGGPRARRRDASSSPLRLVHHMVERCEETSLLPHSPDERVRCPLELAWRPSTATLALHNHRPNGCGSQTTSLQGEGESSGGCRRHPPFAVQRQPLGERVTFLFDRGTRRE